MPHSSLPYGDGFLLASCLFLLSKYLSQINRNMCTSFRLGCLTYSCPMAYVIEDGTS